MRAGFKRETGHTLGQMGGDSKMWRAPAEYGDEGRGRWRQTGGLELPLQFLLALGPWEDSLHAVSLSFLIC